MNVGDLVKIAFANGTVIPASYKGELAVVTKVTTSMRQLMYFVKVLKEKSAKEYGPLFTDEIKGIETNVKKS